MPITDFPMLTTMAGSCPVDDVTLPAASWPFGSFLTSPVAVTGGFEWYGMIFGFIPGRGITQLLPVPGGTTIIAQTRQLSGVPGPPYESAGVKKGQVFVQKAGQVYLVALEVFPIITRYGLSWARPGQLVQTDPTREHTAILNHGNGIYAGTIGFGQTYDETSGFSLDRWFHLLDLRAGVSNIPILDRPVAKGLGAGGKALVSFALAGAGFYEGLWETVVAGNDAAKAGEWLSDTKRTYEVIHSENVGGNTKLVMWPNIRPGAGAQYHPAFSIRARSTSENPLEVPRVGEQFQQSTYQWEEVVE